MDYTKKIRSLKYNGVPMPFAEGKIEIPVPTGWESVVTFLYYQINNYEFIITYGSTTGTYYVNTITKETIKLSDAGSDGAGFYEKNNYVFIAVGNNLKNLIIFDKITKEFNEITVPFNNISLTNLFFVDNNVAFITDTFFKNFSKITITDIDNITIERISFPIDNSWTVILRDASVIELEDKCVFFGQKSFGGKLCKIEIDKTNNYAISITETECPRASNISGGNSVKTNKNFYWLYDYSLIRYNYEDDEVTLLKTFTESSWNIEEIYDVTIDTVGGQNKVELTENLLFHKDSVNSSNPMIYYDDSTEQFIDIAISGSKSSVYANTLTLYRIGNCLFSFKGKGNTYINNGFVGKLDFTDEVLTFNLDTTSWTTFFTFIDYYFNSQNELFIFSPNHVLKYNSTDEIFEVVQKTGSSISTTNYAVIVNPKTNKLQNNLYITYNGTNAGTDRGLWYDLELKVGNYLYSHYSRGKYDEAIIDNEYVLITYLTNGKREHHFSNGEYTYNNTQLYADWSDDGFVPIEETEPHTPEVTVQPNDAGGNTIIIGG